MCNFVFSDFGGCGGPRITTLHSGCGLLLVFGARGPEDDRPLHIKITIGHDMRLNNIIRHNTVTNQVLAI